MLPIDQVFRTVHLAVPGEADHGRGDQEIVRAVRCPAEAGSLHRHVGSDRRLSLVAAPRQRNTDDEKKAIKERRIPPNSKAKPAKLRHKDRDARWTVKFTKAKPREDGSTPPVDLAIPLFGYQNHVSIDRRFGFIRRWVATDAAAYEGRHLRQGLLDKSNTASGVWADTAYRSGQRDVPEQEWLRQPHPSQEAERPRYARDDAAGQQCEIENPLACRACVRRAKGSDGLFIRTIGIARATTKIGMANLVYNIKRFIFLRKIVVA